MKNFVQHKQHLPLKLILLKTFVTILFYFNNFYFLNNNNICYNPPHNLKKKQKIMLSLKTKYCILA